MNHDNIIESVARVQVKTSTSPKTGNDYTQLIIHFHDGYVYKSFLNDEQKQLVKYAVKNKPQTESMLDEDN